MFLLQVKITFWKPNSKESSCKMLLLYAYRNESWTQCEWILIYSPSLRVRSAAVRGYSTDHPVNGVSQACSVTVRTLLSPLDLVMKDTTASLEPLYPIQWVCFHGNPCVNSPHRDSIYQEMWVHAHTYLNDVTCSSAHLRTDCCIMVLSCL